MVRDFVSACMQVCEGMRLSCCGFFLQGDCYALSTLRWGISCGILSSSTQCMLWRQRLWPMGNMLNCKYDPVCFSGAGLGLLPFSISPVTPTASTNCDTGTFQLFSSLLLYRVCVSGCVFSVNSLCIFLQSCSSSIFNRDHEDGWARQSSVVWNQRARSFN